VRNLEIGAHYECNLAPSSVLPLLRGLEWLRLQVWAQQLNDPTYVAGLDSCVDRAHQLGIKTLALLNWLSSSAGKHVDAVQLANDAGTLARHFAGRVSAYELLNEQNWDWSVSMSPQEYAGALRLAYPVIKAADPSATVVTGGTVYSDANYVEALYSAGAKGFFDAVAVHPYPADLSAPPPSGLEDVPSVRTVMLAHGDDKPIWITEFGFSAPMHLSVDQQAINSQAAIQYVRDRLPYVPVMIFYQAFLVFRDNGQWDDTRLINPDLSLRPALAILKGAS
jgi:hypothetical protein